MQNVFVNDLDYVIGREEKLGRLDLSFAEIFPDGPRRFVTATHRLDSGLAWLWFQWLRGSRSSSSQIGDVLSVVVEQSLRLQQEEQAVYWRADHDVLCSHLAVILGNNAQLQKLAAQLISSAAPISTETCLHAWAGLWKYWLLGDKRRSKQEAEKMYSSPKPINLRLPRKPVVQAWLEEDWDAFGKALNKSFSQNWASLRKGSEVEVVSSDRIEFSMGPRSNRTMAHWQENAFAFWAMRQGVDVPTDQLWLPPHAIQCVGALK